MAESRLGAPQDNKFREFSSLAIDRNTLVPDNTDASLMTPLGLTSGEVLTEVDSAGPITLRQLIRKLKWPVHLVMMAVGALIRQGLIRATQHELEVIVESIPEKSNDGQAVAAASGT